MTATFPDIEDKKIGSDQQGSPPGNLNGSGSGENKGGSNPPPPSSPILTKEKQRAETIRLALSLGRILVELRSRVQEANALTPKVVVKEDSDGFWLASTWRGLYNQAVALHNRLELNQNPPLAEAPLLSRYNRKPGEPSYLYQPPICDYLDTGLEADVKMNFALADELRKMLNLLIFLYKAKDNYFAEITGASSVGSNNTPNEAPSPTENNGVPPVIILPDGTKLDPKEITNDSWGYNYIVNDLTKQVEALLTAWDSYIREQLFTRSGDDPGPRYAYEAGRAMAELSWSLTVQSVPYRTEQLLISEQVKAHLQNKAIEEAKNDPSYAQLDVSAQKKLAAARLAILEVDENVKKEIQAKIKLLTSDDFYQIWLDQFKPERIIYLQRQLSSFADVLVAEYKQKQQEAEAAAGAKNATSVNPEASNDDKSPSAPSGKSDFDLKSPHSAIDTILQSLDFWQKTIVEMRQEGLIHPVPQPSNPKNQVKQRTPFIWGSTQKVHEAWTIEHLNDLRFALLEQSNNWFNLLMGRQELTSFKAANVAGDLIQHYSQEMTRLTGQSLQDAFGQIQREVENLASTGLKAVSDIAEAGKKVLGSFFSLKNWWLWATLSVVLVVIVIFAFVFSKPESTLGGLVTAGLTAAGLGAGSLKASNDRKANIDEVKQNGINAINNDKQATNQTLNSSQSMGALLLSTADEAAREVRDFLKNAFNQGFTQLQEELQQINATVGLMAPLVEFVIYHCDPNTDTDFLFGVIWNEEERENQLHRIILAAFGPVGAFLVDNAQAIGSELGSLFSMAQDANKTYHAYALIRNIVGNLDVKLEGNKLIITGKQQEGQQSPFDLKYELNLPSNINIQSVEAFYYAATSTLHLVMPRQQEAQPISITVKLT